MREEWYKQWSNRRKVARGLLLFLSEFCNIKLETEKPSCDQDRGRPNRDAHLESYGRRQEEALKYFKRFGTKTVKILYLACNFHLLLYVYFQYKYDASSLALKHLSDASRHNKQHDYWKNISANEQQQQLWATVASSRSTLQTIGAPYLNLPHLVTACVLIIHITIAFFGYVSASVYFNHIAPMDLYFVRMIMNESKELVRCDEAIQFQVRQFKNSASNFVGSLRALRDGAMATTSYQRVTCTGCMLIWSREQPNTLEDIEQISQVSHQQLAAMYSRGSLIPVNRSHQWLHQTSGRFCLYSVANIIYSLLFDIVVFVLAPIYLVGASLETRLMDIISLCNVLILCQISVISFTFYWALFVANSGDQLNLIKYIQAQLVECRRVNIRDYNSRMFSERRLLENNDSNMHKLNDNLLFAWMSYKMLITQLRPVLKSLQYVINNAAVLMFIMPITFRMHTPYIAQSHRLYSIYMAIAVMVFADNLLIPMAELHYRGLQVYKSLFSLAAHSIECLEHPGASNIYDRHLIWLICKELQQPDRLADQFATQFIWGTLVTYPNLVQLHYWYIVINMSLFFDIKGWRDLMGSRLDDPFGIYQKI